MRRLRDVFYINAYPDNNEIVYYGMQFSEFLKYIPIRLQHLILLKSDFGGSDFSINTWLDIANESNIDELREENIYNYGDFCWVDFNNEDNLEELEQIEVAELLYLAHRFRPLNSPFFEKIDNRYAYLAHDDGWYCRLYCRYYRDFQEIIGNKVVDKVSTSKRRKIYPVPQDVKEQLLSLAPDGLLIDFHNIYKDAKDIEIPIYTIGKFNNMDDMYNGLEKHIKRSKYSARLIHKNKSWKID